MRKNFLLISLLLVAFVMFSCTQKEPVAPEVTQNEEIASLAKEGNKTLGEMTNEELLAWMQEVNENLGAQGLSFALEQIEFYTQGPGRPGGAPGDSRIVRIHQQPFRWVAGDANRLAQGDDITYIADDLNNSGPSSLGSFPTPEVKAGMTTWGADKALKKVNLVDRTGIAAFHTAGVDITIFDGDIGDLSFCPGSDVGGDGNPFAADIVHAGWYPAVCFGPTTLAFSVTFIFGTFVGPVFVPSDVNGDQYLDTALKEVYYNDAFSWLTGAASLPDVDVETVALHESGHSLGIGHFGPPPAAVMNPMYAGPRQSLFKADHSGMATIWNRWPN